MTYQVLTVNCKLSPTNSQAEEIEDTLKAFSDACNWINQTVPPTIRNHVRIHGIVYHGVRTKFGLSANLAVRAIGRVAGNRKTALQNGSKVKIFKPTSIDYDARIFAFREQDEEFSVKLLRSRQNIKLTLGNHQRSLLRGSSTSGLI